MRCAQCGQGNSPEVKFCTACGATLSATGAKAAQPAVPPRPAKKRGKAGGGRPAPMRAGSGRKGLLAVAGAVGVVLLILAARSDPPPAQPSGGDVSLGAGITPVGLAGQVRDVAQEFWCACGTCEVPELADCTCPTAVEQKRFIEQEFDKGGTRPDVVRAVQRRYGGLKPRFATLMDPPFGPIDGASAPPDSLPAGAGPAALIDVGAASLATARVAFLADTTAVAERFSCACGTCGEKPLAECDCEHRRGAAEMKAFIAYKIQQRLSVEDVVQAVAYEYGHLIEGEEGGS